MGGGLKPNIACELNKKFKKKFTRKGKLDLTYLTNMLFSQLQYQNVSGFCLEKHKQTSKRIRKFKPGTDLDVEGPKFKLFKAELEKNEWWKILKDTLWSLATANKDAQPYVFLSEAYKAGELPSDGTNQKEFETYIPCPNYPGKCIKCRSNHRGQHEHETTSLPNAEDGPFHTYFDIKGKAGPVCRVVNVHMASASDNAVDALEKFIKANKDHEDGETPVFFGGDSNVYYGGKNEGLYAGWVEESSENGVTIYRKYPLKDGKPDTTQDRIGSTNIRPTNIRELKDRLEALDYTLVIARHIVRKRRPDMFFNNAQAAYKFEVQAQETMFFAYPTSKKDNVTIDINRDGTKLFNTDLEEMPSKAKVVDAFAGAAYKNWKGIVGGRYEKYLPYLLSDHVPIYFDYTDKTGSYRLLFANTGSLIGERGITDNKTQFGDITLEDLKKWSKELVIPLLNGMIALINDNRIVLKTAGTMEKTAAAWNEKNAGFETILEHANVLSRKNKPDTEVYEVLKVLSKKKWFKNVGDARAAESRRVKAAIALAQLKAKTPTTTGGAEGQAAAMPKLLAVPVPLGRRRMAQREFSSRRDSPVMVRLLEEIIAAQDK